LADRADKVTEAGAETIIDKTIIDKTIIELAQRGVRNPAMLRKMALMEFTAVIE
jgi:hypothetical protein